MANVMDYIASYGDKDFIEKPFNDVDGLILSQFSYLKIDSMVPKVGERRESVKLGDILIHPQVEELFTDERYAENNRRFFEALASSRRFGDIRLNHYINLLSKKWEMQFSAVCCELCDGTTFVAYRGTDETLIGWKEDFNMAYTTPIPAQIKAVDYLNYAAERIAGAIILGGHSKGGNLAVYAGMKCSEYIRRRITRIYSFDGPGFTRKAIEGSDFAGIKPLVRKLVPGSSIIGMLLQSQEEYSVVEAKNYGIFQHDPYNWVVDGDDFVYKEDIHKSIDMWNQSVNEWVRATDSDVMRQFADELFAVLEKAEIMDLNDFKHAETLLKLNSAIGHISDDNKEMMKQLIKSLASTFIETALKSGK